MKNNRFLNALSSLSSTPTRRTIILTLGLGTTIFFLPVSSFACDRSSDCASVCERYQVCFDDGYDVDGCKDRCNDNANDDSFRARTNECDACINERDCVDTAFSCGAECSDVIN